MRVLNRLKVKAIDIAVGSRYILMNIDDARRYYFKVNDRIRISYGEKTITAIVGLTRKYVRPGEIGLPHLLLEELKAAEGDEVTISHVPPLISLRYIRKKMNGLKLSKDEIYCIVKDVVEHKLNEVEIAAFLLAELFRGMDLDEIEYLTRAMFETGERIEFEKPVYDKHSIGGVPGNKVSLLIVPIVAAAGLLIPKTSSKAITSASGTADTMEVLAPVEFTAEEVKEIALKVNGCIVWGGSLNLAPADDIFIRVEHMLSIDPIPQMIASIMSKKMAVSATNVVIDIPMGKGTKVETFDDAKKLAALFVTIGQRLGINVRVGITYGGQPIGHAVGPALEAKEALEALMGKGPSSLIEKSTALAGMLLEMGGIAPRGLGKAYAKEILYSGKALKKMREIIEAQGGDPKIKPDDIPVGDKKIEIKAPCDGYVTDVDNRAITAIARAAGAPEDKGAGVYIYYKKGRKVEKGKTIMTIYAESEEKLTEAYNLALKLNPITIEGMLLAEYP